jgi:tetratricopeptide (TPR) repeat protein
MGEEENTARATGQYLTLGDQAFRDGRFADAVHFYARAVQFSPDDAVLWLVLSDGLFATGDYHYGAFALRKALELDASLASNPIDKHEFYTEPSAFDGQLAVLESYVLDHPNDIDAVLMLAANYLFGGRPAAAVDLMEGDTGTDLRRTPAGEAILAAAREIQYGR